LVTTYQCLADGKVDLVVRLPQVLQHHCRACELLEGAVLLAQVGQAYGVVDEVIGAKVVAVGAACKHGKTRDFVSRGGQQLQMVWWMIWLAAYLLLLGQPAGLDGKKHVSDTCHSVCSTVDGVVGCGGVWWGG
jgi:hypothetical protein